MTHRRTARQRRTRGVTAAAVSAMTLLLAACTPPAGAPAPAPAPSRASEEVAPATVSAPEWEGADVDVCAWAEAELAALDSLLTTEEYEIGFTSEDFFTADRVFGADPFGGPEGAGCEIETSRIGGNQGGGLPIDVSLQHGDTDWVETFSEPYPIAGGYEVLDSEPPGERAIVILDDDLLLSVSTQATSPGFMFAVRRIAQILAPTWAEGYVPRFPREGVADRFDGRRFCLTVPDAELRPVLAELTGEVLEDDQEIDRGWNELGCSFSVWPYDARVRITPTDVGQVAESCPAEEIREGCTSAHVAAGDGWALRVVLVPGLGKATTADLRKVVDFVPTNLLLASDASAPAWTVEDQTGPPPSWVSCSSDEPTLGVRTASATLVVCGVTSTITAPGIRFSGLTDDEGCFSSEDSPLTACWNPLIQGAALTVMEPTPDAYIERVREHPREIWYTEGLFG